MGRRKVGMKLTLSLFSALITLGLLFIVGEWYMRSTQTRIVEDGSDVHDPLAVIQYTTKGRRLVPGARVTIRNHYLSNRDVPMRINQLGFRDDELQSPKPANEWRALMLGDSITWGDYIPADEVFVEVAEKVMNLAANSSKRFQLINAGVGDIGIIEQIGILVEKGIAAEPDVVVLGFYLNDSRPPWGFAQELGARGWIRQKSALIDTIYRKLKLASFIQQKGRDRFEWVNRLDQLDWRTKRADFDQLVQLAQYDWGAAWQESSWPVVEENVERLAELSRKHHFEIAGVVFPVSYQVYSVFVDDQPQQRFVQLMKQYDAPVLDLLPLLRNHNFVELMYDNCHPNTYANDKIGNALARFLQVHFLRE